MAELGDRQSETFIRAIHDGKLGIEDMAALSAHDREVCTQLQNAQKANPTWAKGLEQARAKEGVLRPKDIWPNLKLIGCWLGGSCGVQANRLIDWYGDVAFRDPGFRATEATMSVPIRDSTAEGVLALNANFYEFIPVEEIDSASPRVLLADELEVGAHYYILLTTRGGLCRYDINDIIEVTGTYHNSPLVAFLRKGRDMVNITGEKLHVNQVYQAAQRASEHMNWQWEQIQLIPDAEAARYDLLVEPLNGECALQALRDFALAFDAELSGLNMEFAHKRKSRRLHLPRVHHMRPGWSKDHQRADVAGGKRDGQYKWPFVRNEWHAMSKECVVDTIEDPAAFEDKG